MFEKHPWKSDILSKDAVRRTGFYISGRKWVKWIGIYSEEIKIICKES